MQSRTSSPVIGADVPVGERAEDQPPERPVHDADAVQVPRPERRGRTSPAAATRSGRYFGSCEKSASIWQIRSASPRERPAGSPRRTTGPSPRLPVRCSTSHAARVLARQLVGHRAGAVRRLVVDDQHAVADAGRESAPTSDRQVLAFVVGRDDDRTFMRVSRRRRAASQARRRRETISAGSMTGIRNRSCGKNTRHTSSDDAASSSSGDRQASGAARAAHAPRQRRTAARARYGTTDAPKYSGECSRYDGPDGHDRVERLARRSARSQSSGCSRMQRQRLPVVERLELPRA